MHADRPAVTSILHSWLAEHGLQAGNQSQWLLAGNGQCADRRKPATRAHRHLADNLQTEPPLPVGLLSTQRRKGAACQCRARSTAAISLALAAVQGKPLFVIGVSSGASFALKLPETVAVHGVVSGTRMQRRLCGPEDREAVLCSDGPPLLMHGRTFTIPVTRMLVSQALWTACRSSICAEVLGLAAGSWDALGALGAAFPPTAFISMPRDVHTAAKIADSMRLLRGHGVPADLLEVRCSGNPTPRRYTLAAQLARPPVAAPPWLCLLFVTPRPTPTLLVSIRQCKWDRLTSYGGAPASVAGAASPRGC